MGYLFTRARGSVTCVVLILTVMFRLCEILLQGKIHHNSYQEPNNAETLAYERATVLQVSNFLLRLDVTLHKMLYLR